MTTLLSTRHLLAHTDTRSSTFADAVGPRSTAAGQERAGVRGSQSRITTTHEETCPSSRPTLIGPGGSKDILVINPVRFRWNRVPDASRYRVVYSLEGGNGKETVLGETSNSELTGTVPLGLIKWKVYALGPHDSHCSPIVSEDLKFTAVGTQACTSPSIAQQPAGGTVDEGQSVTLSVTASGTAPLAYQWYRDGAATGTNSNTYTSGPLTQTTTFSVTVTNACGTSASEPVLVTVKPNPGTTCKTLGAPPAVNAVAAVTSGVAYAVRWSAVANASAYDIEEARDASFGDASRQRVETLSATFVRSAKEAASRWYRVRGVNGCNDATTEFSKPIRVAIVPEHLGAGTNTDLIAPYGGRDVLTSDVTVDVDPAAIAFSVASTEPWMSVTPAAGSVPPGGRLALSVTIDPAELPYGTSMTSLRVTTTAGAAGRVETNGSTTVTVPISVSLVTPVSPVSGTAAKEVLLIPAVAHTDGSNSRWQSDVRIAHSYASAVRYRLVFRASGTNMDDAIQTELVVKPGETIALDDLLGRWFGAGLAAGGATGVLEIRATDASGSGRTFATSRLFNLAANGTFGQFVNAVPLAQFLRTGDRSRQTLVAVAQSSAYRTNIGLVEGSGKPADVVLDVFDGAGLKLFSESLSLRAGEHRQIGAMLAAHGVETANARISVSLASPNASVFSYASVVDNTTGDPSFVPAVDERAESRRTTIAGAANLPTLTGKWQTDMRLYNAGAANVTATLEFFRQGESTAAATREVEVAAGETRALDDVVQSLFGLAGAGGAVRISTPVDAPLIAAARTYHARPDGTFGQFIAGATDANATGAGRDVLRILQVEESVRFRTNIGVTEVSGRPATIEIAANVPGHKVSAVTRVALQPNEFRQLNSLLRAMGFDDAYNASVSVRVVGGEGNVIAYGSVIDGVTQDPTYVLAQ